jgi:hypothetical protein
LAGGRIDADQAQVITTAVDTLPTFVGEADRRRAEAHLLSAAARFDHLTVKKLATHLLEVLDPEGTEEHLAKTIEAEEARAARKTSLQMRSDGHGTVTGSFVIPQLQADMLTVALNAIASPQRPDPLPRHRPAADPAAAGDGADGPAGGSGGSGGMEPIPTPELRGLAFVEYIERFPTDALPAAGGSTATVVVTMTLETLLGGLKVAQLDTGTPTSAGEARRLAAQAGVIPLVLGTGSEVLDLGRRARLASTAQRTALRARQHTCTVEGCTIPAATCHVHHTHPWATGGRTTLNDLTLLCPRHHRLIHRPGFEASYDGPVTRIVRTTRRRT